MNEHILPTWAMFKLFKSDQCPAFTVEPYILHAILYCSLFLVTFYVTIWPKPIFEASWWSIKYLKKQSVPIGLILSIYYLSMLKLCCYLFIYESTYVAIYLSIYLSVWLSVYLSNYVQYLGIYLSICASHYLSIHLCIHQSIHLCIHRSIHLSPKSVLVSSKKPTAKSAVFH